MRSFLIILAALAVFAASNVQADFVCEKCQKIGAEIKKNLNNKTEQTLLQLCDKMPQQDLKGLCLELVHHAQYLLDHSPLEFCQKHGLCQNAHHLKRLFGNRKDLKEIERLRDNLLANYQHNIISLLKNRSGSFVECKTCVMIVERVQEMVKKLETLSAIDKGIEFACKRFAGRKVDDCVQIAKAYVHQAIHLIEEQSPKEICALIGECRSSQKSLFLTRVGQGFACDECKNVASWVKTNIDNPKVEEALLTLSDYLSVACEQISDEQLKDQCIKYTVGSIKILIQKLKTLTPSAVCQSLHLC